MQAEIRRIQFKKPLLSEKYFLLIFMYLHWQTVAIQVVEQLHIIIWWNARDSAKLYICSRQNDVLVELQSLDTRKASVLDGIHAVILKNCAPELSLVLTRLDLLSYFLGIVPEAWRKANVQTIPKKTTVQIRLIGDFSHHFFSLHLCKVLERIINKQLVHHLENHSQLKDRQYGLRQKRSESILFIEKT